MQKLTEKELQGFRNEFDLTCAAQDGNGKAWLALWNHYKAMMMSRLIAVKGLSHDELESEACEVFAHKLEIFKRGKVTSEDAYSMFSWLYCGTMNATDKLIRQREQDVHLYFEDVNAAFSTEDKGTTDEGDGPDFLVDQMIGISDEIYNVYNPERLVVEKLHESDTVRVKAFYARLTQFERNVLESRQEGLTLSNIAKKFCCSVTTVKNHIQVAKQYAEDIFQVCYV
jgi:DNA-directed RNA polymerase specialized sigma24 family protein